MRLIEVGPDDSAGIDAFVALENAVHAADSPWCYPSTPYRLEMRIRHGWDGEPGRFFLAYDDRGEPVGYVEVDSSVYDNLELAWLSVTVRPDARREGHGRRALDAALDVCREMGRPLIGSHGWDNAGTRGFAAATGFEQRSVVVSRRMTLADVPTETVDACFADAAAHAGDYELVQISGRTPDDLLDALARSTAAINDAPMDDLEYEAEVFTPERVRRYEAAQIDGGHRFYRLLARHRDSGEIGGLSVVTADVEQPADGDQHDTSVVRAHRGHRLGLLLKAGMVRWLAEAEPGLRTIETSNAESNGHMIAVNKQLGYRVLGRELQFQQRL